MIESLLTITNPNPRPLAVWRGAKLTDVLRTHDQLTTPLGEGIALSCSKRALVVLSVEGGELDGEQWVQEIGTSPVLPDIGKAVRQTEAAV